MEGRGSGVIGVANGKKGKGKRDNVSHLMLTQQLKPQFWDWVDSDEAERAEADGTIVTQRLGLTRDEAVSLIERAASGDLQAVAGLGAEIVRRLEYSGSVFLYDKIAAGQALTDWESDEDSKHEGSRVAAAYIILHDKDTWTDYSGEEPVECLKEPHVHMVVVFESEKRNGRSVPASASPAYLAKRIGIPLNGHIDLPRKGGPTFDWPGYGKVSSSLDNKLAYLTHAKYEEKFQYDPAEVITARGPGYLPIDRARRPDWLKGRAHIKKQQAAEAVEDLVEKCITGQITKEVIELDDDLLAVYGRHKRKVDDALRTRSDAEATRKRVEVERTLGTEWTKSGIAVTGPRRSGKEAFAADLLEKLTALARHAGQQWQTVRPPGQHALESVGSAELVHHEDGRFRAFRSYDQMLRYLDPNESVEAEGRYYSRQAPAPRVAVLTTSNTLYEFGLSSLARKPTEVLEADAATSSSSRAPADIDEFLLRLGWVVEVQKPVRTVDDICVAEDIGTAEAFEIFKQEAMIGFYRPKEKSARRTETVRARNGARLGEITTTAEMEPVGMLKGVDRAARFLAVEIMHGRNGDIIAALPEEITARLNDEHRLIAGDLVDRKQQVLDAAELGQRRCGTCGHKYSALDLEPYDRMCFGCGPETHPDVVRCSQCKRFWDTSAARPYGRSTCDACSPG